MSSLVAFCIFTGALKGRLNFQELPNKTVAITGNINGLPQGMHGFHVHEHGNLGNSCMAAGDHFNPAQMHHGGPNDAVRHAGDFGNINSNADMNAFVNFMDNKVSLDPNNQFSIINRTLVVHSKQDDLGKGGNLESLKTGNAGTRLDCCIITRSQSRSSAFNTRPVSWSAVIALAIVVRLLI